MNRSDYCDHPTTNVDHPPLDVFVSTLILSLPPLDQTIVSKSPPPIHYNHLTHPWTDFSLSRSISLSFSQSLSRSLSHNQFGLNLLFFVSFFFLWIFNYNICLEVSKMYFLEQIFGIQPSTLKIFSLENILVILHWTKHNLNHKFAIIKGGKRV